MRLHVVATGFGLCVRFCVPFCGRLWLLRPCHKVRQSTLQLRRIPASGGVMNTCGGETKSPVVPDVQYRSLRVSTDVHIPSLPKCPAYPVHRDSKQQHTQFGSMDWLKGTPHETRSDEIKI